MIQTLTFGYLPNKWKRLIRTTFLFYYLFCLNILSSDGHYNFSDHSLENIGSWEINFLVINFLLFFILSYILKPFVIKEKD